MFLGWCGFHGRKSESYCRAIRRYGSRRWGKGIGGLLLECKSVYWVIICPNSVGANGRMKGRAQPHTYAWLWHCELWGLAQKTMTNYVCRLSYQKMCWAGGGSDRPSPLLPVSFTFCLCPRALRHSQVSAASFSPILISLSGSLLAVCATKLRDSSLVDSAVKCINSPSL